MKKVSRVLVEKNQVFAVEREKLFSNIVNYLEIKAVKALRVINCYDIEGLDDSKIADVAKTILSEINTDHVYFEELDLTDAQFGTPGRVMRFMPLPGQFDLRSESARQCINALLEDDSAYGIESSHIIVLYGDITDQDFARIQAFFVNPVETMVVPVGKPLALMEAGAAEDDTWPVAGFLEMSREALSNLKQTLRLALTEEDLVFVQKYYAEQEKRVPTLTEIRVLDVYWSDHCRHTTFNTEITAFNFDGNNLSALEKAYDTYMNQRKAIYGDREKAVTLMDLAIIAAKVQKKNGNLNDLEESDEINAASIRVPVRITTEDGEKTEPYLVMFKNETHNHPTEIEPFGGASTCLGGAIRDPLSGRSYVYHSMRVTGAADPRRPLSETLPGKLSQRKITTDAARGFSSYGNQIGLATGHVSEVYHDGYLAKRMEVGAVIAAVPEKAVVRMKPADGDLVIMIGGRTGRDGCGGASGSSVEHTEDSLMTCGAEVQKGNAPEERKLQRLFRNQAFSVLVKKCNDFGAGGVSVAIGEMADSIDIWLDRVPKKYEGLTGTELAISESQERMAIMIDPSNLEAVKAMAEAENLESTVVAQVTDSGRLRMFLGEKTILDISREFLDSNGATSYGSMAFAPVELKAVPFNAYESVADNKLVETVLTDLNVCSQRGLVELFDSSIGSNTVMLPYGGKYQKTPAQTMVARVAVAEGRTSTCSLMSYGFDPEISSWSPFHGAHYSVLSSIAKMVATGGDLHKIRFTFQEYFEKLGNSPEKWGKPFSSLLAANQVLADAGLAAIGGKDSMSGTFNDINVPPTLISFAVATAEDADIITPEFKQAGSVLAAVIMSTDREHLVLVPQAIQTYETITNLMRKGWVRSASAIGKGGILAGVLKSAFGNGVGFKLDLQDRNLLTASLHGGLLLELAPEFVATFKEAGIELVELGQTVEAGQVTILGQVYELNQLTGTWESTLEPIFPTKPEHWEMENAEQATSMAQTLASSSKASKTFGATILTARPKVVIPVFPGTNCEYDTARVFQQAGAEVETIVFRNLNHLAFAESLDRMEKAVKSANILVLPGGFSAGDEPDGSGKYIASVLRNPRMREAVNNLLKNRDGLAIGICNGFQALVKLGLTTYGEICDLDENSPTLTFNNIGRHQSKMVNVRIAGAETPWLSGLDRNQIYKTPISHGEGRFYAEGAAMDAILANNQIATMYCDLSGKPSMHPDVNPNGSHLAIEGVVSPDGRVLGKMGHNERVVDGLFKNIPDMAYMDVFSAGVRYFKG